MVWNSVKILGSDAEHHYWTTIEFMPSSGLNIKDTKFVVNKLINLGRLNSAFYAAIPQIENLPSKLLLKLLSIISCENKESKIIPSNHSIEEIFNALDKDPNISDEIIAEYEWQYLPILVNINPKKSKRVTAWHRLISKDPKYLIIPLIWAYEREDHTEEPHFKNATQIEIHNNSRIGHQLLEGWVQIPGLKNGDEFDEKSFLNWVKETYKASKNVNRVKAFEHYLSKIIIRYSFDFPSDDWLPSSMLKLLEQNEYLRQPIPILISNARGVTMRGADQGGKLERDLALEYSKLASKFKMNYPNIAKTLTQVAKQFEEEAKFHDIQAELYER